MVQSTVGQICSLTVSVKNAPPSKQSRPTKLVGKTPMAQHPHPAPQKDVVDDGALPVRVSLCKGFTDESEHEPSCSAFPQEAVMSKNRLSGAVSFCPSSIVRGNMTDFRWCLLNTNCLMLEVIL